MRENRPYGSEGGVAMSHPDPYPLLRAPASTRSWVGARKQVPKSNKETEGRNARIGPPGGPLTKNAPYKVSG